MLTIFSYDTKIVSFLQRRCYASFITTFCTTYIDDVIPTTYLTL